MSAATTTVEREARASDPLLVCIVEIASSKLQSRPAKHADMHNRIRHLGLSQHDLNVARRDMGDIGVKDSGCI